MSYYYYYRIVDIDIMSKGRDVPGDAEVKVKRESESKFDIIPIKHWDEGGLLRSGDLGSVREPRLRQESRKKKGGLKEGEVLVAVLK